MTLWPSVLGRVPISGATPSVIPAKAGIQGAPQSKDQLAFRSDLWFRLWMALRLSLDESKWSQIRAGLHRQIQGQYLGLDLWPQIID